MLPSQQSGSAFMEGPNDLIVLHTAMSACVEGISPTPQPKAQVPPVRTLPTPQEPMVAKAGVAVSPQSPLRSQSAPALEKIQESSQPSDPSAASACGISRVTKWMYM